MADDFLKKYEEEYEAIYGNNDYNTQYQQPQPVKQTTYQQPQPVKQTTYQQQQLPLQTYQNQNSLYEQNLNQNYQGEYKAQTYNQPQTTSCQDDFNLQDYYGGNKKQVAAPKQNNAQQEDNFSLQDYYGGSKKTTQPQTTNTYNQQQDNFSLDDYYGTKKTNFNKQPVAPPVDDGLSYADFCNGGVKKAQSAQQKYDQNYDNQGYYDNQGQYHYYDYSNTNQQYSQYQTNNQNQYSNQQYSQNQQSNQNQYYDNNYQQQTYQDPNKPSGMTQAEWDFKQQVTQNLQKNKEQDLAAEKERQDYAYQQQYYQNLTAPKSSKPTIPQYQAPKSTSGYDNSNYYNSYTAPTQQYTGSSYGDTNQNQQSSYSNFSQSKYQNYPTVVQSVKVNNPYQTSSNVQTSQPTQGAKTQVNSNGFLTHVAGDVAVSAVEQNMTAENVEAASKHATKENAVKAYDGAVYLDGKADEYGIDKKAVAQKAGNAAWAGGKALANADIDWGKVAGNVQKANQ